MSGSVANAKPTLITGDLRFFQSDRATEASVGIGKIGSSSSTKSALWLTTWMRAEEVSAITPATKFACAASASRCRSPRRSFRLSPSRTQALPNHSPLVEDTRVEIGPSGRYPASITVTRKWPAAVVKNVRGFLRLKMFKRLLWGFGGPKGQV